MRNPVTGIIFFFTPRLLKFPASINDSLLGKITAANSPKKGKFLAQNITVAAGKSLEL